MIRCIEIRCIECNGTGSSVPDCPLCDGYRGITVVDALADGYDAGDLIDVEDDGFCECPRCGDDACCCMFCGGDGKVAPMSEAQQRGRVLIAARDDHRIPPCFSIDRRDGRLTIDPGIDRLSAVAAGACRDEGLITWFCSVFGDEISLTAEGETAARAAWTEYRALCRRWIAAERERRIERQLIALIADRPRVAEVAW